VSDLPDQNTWAYLHLDVQSQDPRQAQQMDPGWRRDSPADLSGLSRRDPRDANRDASFTFTRDFTLVIISFFFLSPFTLPFASHNGNARARTTMVFRLITVAITSKLSHTDESELR